MPNNRKHTLKNIKGKHVAHPYSRKANQITRSLLRTERLGQRKKERDINISPIADRYQWFGEMLVHTGRNVLSHTELFSLVDIYMKRHDEELARLRKQRKYGNRPKSAREDLLASIMATESKEFYGNGIDIPDITDEANVEVLLGWQGDKQAMAQIRKMRVHNRLLTKYNVATEVNETNADSHSATTESTPNATTVDHHDMIVA